MKTQNELENAYIAIQNKLVIAKQIKEKFNQALALVKEATELDKSNKYFDIDSYARLESDVYALDRQDKERFISQEEYDLMHKEVYQLDLASPIYRIVDAVGWSSSSLQC